MKSSIFWLLIGVDDAVALARVEHQVQTVRRCPKHCSFCSMWRTDGPKPRPRPVNPVIEEIVELRRMGFRFVALADDNFYPVTLEDLRMADRREDKTRYEQLKALRDERFELMAQMEKLPKDLVFYTQITMEAAEDTEFLDAMRRARILGALVGVQAVTPDGLKDVYKEFNLAGEKLVERFPPDGQAGPPALRRRAHARPAGAGAVARSRASVLHSTRGRPPHSGCGRGRCRRLPRGGSRGVGRQRQARQTRRPR